MNNQPIQQRARFCHEVLVASFDLFTGVTFANAAIMKLHRKSGEAFIALEAILMKQQRFTQEFKDEAVRLVLTSGRR